LVTLVLGAFFIVLLNMDVVTQVGELQGNNKKIYQYKIPLYLKVLNFFDRHFNYVWLVESIIGNTKNDEEKFLKLLEWMVGHIKKQPENLPIIDEHVWSVIVRRYGNIGNFNDVFSTLCNYAGINSFLKVIKTKKIMTVITLTHIEKKWVVADPYNGVYFRNKKGDIADIRDMKSGDFITLRINNITNEDIDYSLILEGLPENIIFGRLGIGRANIQSPINRILFQFNHWIRITG